MVSLKVAKKKKEFPKKPRKNNKEFESSFKTRIGQTISTLN